MARPVRGVVSGRGFPCSSGTRVEPCDSPAVALIRPCFAAQNPEQGRLARAVGTEQGHVVSGEQIEVDMIQGAEALHGNGYLAETDKCCGHDGVMAGDGKNGQGRSRLQQEPGQ